MIRLLLLQCKHTHDLKEYSAAGDGKNRQIQSILAILAGCAFVVAYISRLHGKGVWGRTLS